MVLLRSPTRPIRRSPLRRRYPFRAASAKCMFELASPVCRNPTSGKPMALLRCAVLGGHAQQFRTGVALLIPRLASGRVVTRQLSLSLGGLRPHARRSGYTCLHLHMNPREHLPACHSQQLSQAPPCVPDRRLAAVPASSGGGGSHKGGSSSPS